MNIKNFFQKIKNKIKNKIKKDGGRVSAIRSGVEPRYGRYGGLVVGVLVLMVMVIVFSFLFFRAPEILGRTFHWVQTDWGGGADTTIFPSHPANQTGWTKFFLRDLGMTIGPDLTLTSTSTSITQTTDVDFSAGAFSQTRVKGTGAAAVVELTTAAETGQIAAGSNHTLAIRTDGTLWA